MEGYYEHTDFEASSECIRRFESNIIREGYIVHPHWHEHMEILYIRSGQALQQVDDVYREVVQGDLILIGCNQIHGTYPVNGRVADIEVYQMKIDPILPQTMDKRRHILNAMSGGLDIELPVKHDGDKIREALRNTVAISSEDKRIEQCEKNAGVLNVIVSLLSTFDSTDEPSIPLLSIKARNALERIFEYLRSHYMEDLSVDDAAAIAGYSRAQFNRLMKTATGSSFIEYLNQKRIDASLGMMLKGCSVTESALASGFGSITSFNRHFKRYKGSSPTEYLNRFVSETTNGGVL